MKSKNVLCGLAIAVVLQLGMLPGSAQTNIYLFSGSETNITLPPGTYIITAYGAPGGHAGPDGGGGAEMSAEFNFSTSTNLTLLVGRGGGANTYGGFGGGGGSFVVEVSTPLVIAGGGGGASGKYNPGGDGLPLMLPFFTGGAGGAGGLSGSTVQLPPGPGGGGGGGGFFGNGGDGGNSLQNASLGYNTGGSGGLSFTGGGGGGYSGGDDSGPVSGGYGGGGGGGGYTYGGDFGPTGGGGGGGGGYTGGWGGDGDGNGGAGGFSIIDPSAITILAGVSGIASPDDPTNGEIIIIAVPTPLLIPTHAAFGFTNGVFGFNVIGPSGSNVVIQASTDLRTWVPLQTNLLGSGPLYFSDPQSTTNVQRFYRAQLSPAYTVGGTLTGLPAFDTVTLQDNGTNNLTLSANGTFTFPTALPDGHAYSVTVSGTSGLNPMTCTITHGSGTVSGANVTNVLVQCTYTGEGPEITGNKDLDMYNAAVADGTANGGVPGVMLTQNGGPFRVTALGRYSENVAEIYTGWAVYTQIVGTGSCSSTTFPSGTWVIQFGTPLACEGGFFEY